MAERPKSSTSKIIIYLVSWWVASVVVIVIFKFLVSDHVLDFPFPFFTSGSMNIFVCLFGYIFILRPGSRDMGPKAMSERQQLNMFSHSIAIIGVIQGLEVALSNKILQFMNVTDRQLLSALYPLVMLLVSILCGLETFTWQLFAIMGTICIGGVLANSDGGAMHVSSAFICVLMTASVATAVRSALMQRVLQEKIKNLSPMELVLTVSPYTALICFISSFVFESDLYHLQNGGDLTPTVYGMNKGAMVAACIISCSLGICVLMYAEFGIVQDTSALALSVFQSMHNFFIILGGVAFFHDKISTTRGVGYFVAQIGIVGYAMLRLYTKQEEEEREEQKWLLEDQSGQSPSCSVEASPTPIGNTSHSSIKELQKPNEGNVPKESDQFI